MAFRTRVTPRKAEPATKKASMTQPDEALTVRQLFARAAAGQPLGGSSLYSGYQDEPHIEDHDLRELQDMDLAERQEILENEKTFFSEMTKKKKPAERASETSEPAGSEPKEKAKDKGEEGSEGTEPTPDPPEKPKPKKANN